MKFKKLGAWLLFVVVIPFAFYSNLYLIKRETRSLARLERGGHYLDSRLYEQRLRPLREFLPRDAVVGYVTDDGAETSHSTEYYFLTQYVLCPVLVVEGRNHPYVIGSYYTMDSPHRTATGGLTLVKDFGYGIGLYRGRDK